MGITELSYRSPVPVPAGDALAWHARPGAFERLTPPWMNVTVAESRGATAPGDWKRLHVKVGPVGVDWTVAHQALPDRPGTIGFLDEQQSGPFRAWRHEHRFTEVGGGTSVLEDRIAYRLPLGAPGEAVAGHRVRAQLDELFGFRHRRTGLDLARHAEYRGAPLGIVVSGSSGLVGRQLVAFLRTGGHTVYRLVRRKPTAEDEIYWNPRTGEIDAAALDGMDAVVHLAGESIADGRWSGARKERIRESRVGGTRLLSDAIARLPRPPSVLVSASATGYYGDRADALLTEDADSGEGFLAGVCRAWEDAAGPAAAAGIRIVTPRFGVVLAGGGGLLDRVGTLFRLGLGGRLGSGEQFLGWIALDDVLGVLHRAIVDPALAGPVNAVAPHPVTNRDFTATLGRVLGRPAVLPVPAFGLKLAFGDMADELLLASQRVVPARLTERGFAFAFPELERALRHELGRFGGIPSSFAVSAATHHPGSPGPRGTEERRDAA